ncbi:MAG: prephenate dehydrogenase/arogenate dehydrogenase family protein, partial [Desulfofustis sp.]|nr:prephenate dehydrogenase/arogenate dehydrogenase family protein [Desulfofustis sp.]
MSTIATLGPHGSDGYQAARQYDPQAALLLFNNISDLIAALSDGRANYAFVPVYNTREGEVREYFRVLEGLEQGHWIDNVVLPINLSLGALHGDQRLDLVQVIVGRSTVFRQCEEYIAAHMPDATLVSVRDLEAAAMDIRENRPEHYVLIDTEEVINRTGLALIARELAPYNRTRFAVIGRDPAGQTGYDATSIMTRPLADRVGLLV